MKTGQRFDVIVAFLSSARFVTALTTATVGAATCAFALRHTIGWAGLLGIIAGLVILFVIVLVMKRGEIEWNGLLPISLIVFVGWAGLSVFWSQYQWVTLGSLVYFCAFTVLGVSVALLRDTIQIVRAFGDVLRFTLLLSLIVEIISGLLIDSPIHFLGVAGNLDNLGPLQGILGSRNQLGIVAIVALVTFATELRTRSVQRGWGVGSLILAGLCVLMSQSPVALGATLVVGASTLVLFGLRRVEPAKRQFWQFGLFGAVFVAAVSAWIFRSRLIDALDASSELSYRLDLWRQVWDLIPLHALEGWGWVGAWRDNIQPFLVFQSLPGGIPGSAANAFLDVWFQLGVVGLLAFLVLLVLAFVRSWLLAVQRRSIVFAWPALVLVALVTTSLAESSILFEFGWLAVLVCTVKASRELSWRQAFAVAPEKQSLPAEPST